MSQPLEVTKPKFYWVTNLRVLATLTVIMLHAASFGIYRLGSIPNSWWWICNIMNCFGRFAVPIFVMLSGYLLLGRYDELEIFLKKRLARIFIPFIIWTIIYILWGNYFGFTNEKTTLTFAEIIKKILVGGAGGSGHLWFVYMLLGLYAFTPYISKWLRQASNAEIKFFFLLWFISSAIFPIVSFFFNYEIKFDLRYFSGYLGYYVLGYYLGNKKFSLKTPPITYLSAILFLVSWAITAYGIYFFTAKNHNIYDTRLFDYLSPSVILMSISIFLFFKNSLNSPFIPLITNNLDTTSYGIYLCHFIVLRWLSREYQLNYTWHHPLLGITAQFLVTTLICYAFIWLISKLPKGHWITG